MSQKNNTVNFLIHDTNGQPQMVKVVQNTAKQPPTAQIKINNALKVIKVPNTSDGSQKPAVYRAVKVTNIKGASKLVQVPIHTLAQLQKSSGEALIQSSSQEQKVQAQNIQEVIQTVPELVPIPARHTTVVSTTPTPPPAPPAPPSNSKPQLPPIMSNAPRKRFDDSPVPEYTTKRRKHADKVGKGLRHFSMKVCEKVRNKGFTSYNEVADELVEEFAAGIHGTADSQQYDQKNIRRRVYDALNVLMAMNIISKEKKEIRWLGLPTNSIQECNTLEKEKQSRLEKIQKKSQQLNELLLQKVPKLILAMGKLTNVSHFVSSKYAKLSVINFIALVIMIISSRSVKDFFPYREMWFQQDGCPAHYARPFENISMKSFPEGGSDGLVQSRPGRSPDLNPLYFFYWGAVKEKCLDKGECTEKDLEKAKSMVPKSLESYVEQMGRGVSTKLTDILEELSDVDDDTEERLDPEEAAAEGSELEDEPEPLERADGADYSDDSDDLDV
ncbi:Transcription factor Dp-1 [Eumeta japonica]|uniref:Transcription factor Dp-1 n=1 Tax=Eumeta variegata TaxID=151549 RepID=A0A4C1YKS1_EUMVA|nr:Transcription factor Dp-1 [Eumeta japonica]